MKANRGRIVRGGPWAGSGFTLVEVLAAVAIVGIVFVCLVEAFRVADARAFALGVQWHPEWKVMENEDSLAIFRRFGDAARHYAEGKGHG